MFNNNLVESTVECFGKIPEHWREAPLRYYLKYEKGSNAALYTKEFLGDNEGVVPVYSGQTANNGILGYTNRTDYSDTHGIIVSTVGAKAMSTQLISGDFCLSQNCALITSRGDYNISFAHYLLSLLFSFEKAKLANVMIPSLRFEDLDSYSLLVPPLSEQSQIAAFLDQKTAQIDTIIEKKQKLLQLLDEKKKSIINEAVTGQKVWDGNTWIAPIEVKDSGVEWIGNIPKDWSVLKMRRILELKSGDFISANDIEAEGVYPVYGGNGIRGYTTKFNREGTFPLIGRQGALCGNVNYSSGKFWATEHALLVSPLKVLNLRYFGELLDIMNLNQYSVASAQPGLSVERLLDLEILFPPVSNQILIADFITKQRSKFNNIMEKISLQIIKLQEYRQSIISEAVTGKLKI